MGNAPRVAYACPVLSASRERNHVERNLVGDSERQWVPGDGDLFERVGISSSESYPSQAEAITAAALKLLDMPKRLEEFDATEIDA